MNWRPNDLQSLALPLSYTRPTIWEPNRAAPTKSQWRKLDVESSIPLFFNFQSNPKTQKMFYQFLEGNQLSTLLKNMFFFGVYLLKKIVGHSSLFIFFFFSFLFLFFQFLNYFFWFAWGYLFLVCIPRSPSQSSNHNFFRFDFIKIRMMMMMNFGMNDRSSIDRSIDQRSRSTTRENWIFTKSRAAARIELATSCTLSKNHAPRPSGHQDTTLHHFYWERKQFVFREPLKKMK